MTRTALLCAALACLGCERLSNVDHLRIVEPPDADDEWACLSSRQPADLPDTVRYRGAVSFVPSNEPVMDVVVRLCETTDDADGRCSKPVLDPIHSPDGAIEFEVAGTFNGYIELTSPNAVPTVVELWRPIGRMRVLPELKMLKPETLSAFAAVMKTAIEPDLGHAMFWIENCSGERAAGGRVEVIDNDDQQAAQLAPSTVGYYAVDGRLPSVSVGETDASGGGGIVNLPPFFWTFEGLVAADSRRITRFAARIRAGQITTFVVEPD